MLCSRFYYYCWHVRERKPLTALTFNQPYIDGCFAALVSFFLPSGGFPSALRCQLWITNLSNTLPEVMGCRLWVTDQYPNYDHHAQIWIASQRPSHSHRPVPTLWASPPGGQIINTPSAYFLGLLATTLPAHRCCDE